MGALQRELKQLSAAGIIRRSEVGRQAFFTANSDSPVFSELRNLIIKTFGVADVINHALSPLAGHIVRAFIFGSVASGKETANSDIDLMIIGNAGFAEVVSALYPVQQTLGREVNPKIYREKEWNQMLKSKDAFVKEILEKPRMDVMGDADEPG